MKKIHFKVGRIVFILLIISMFCFLYTPYKIMAKLPKLSIENVESITLWVANNPIIDNTDDLNDIVNWYNKAKELKKEYGTTSDCRIDIYLKDKSKIKIWNLYSNELVTIGYEKGALYYQTNVYSPQIANYFNEVRNKYMRKLE